MSDARGPARRRVAWAAVAGLVALACTELSVTLPGPVVSVRVTPDTLVLRVGDSAQVSAVPLDETGALRSQASVGWASGAAAVASVDSTGLVRATGAGTTTIAATVNGITGSAAAIVTGAPAAIAAFAGDGQSAAVNSAVSVAPAVRVTDAGGNPVAFVPVTFAVASGGGSVTGAGPVFTDLNGVAAVGSWTLGPSPVTNTLSATAGDPGVAGNPVTFTATATVGPPSAAQSTIVASPSQIAPISGVATITVTVRDAAGSTITGATVTLAVSGSGNVINQPADTTDASGQTTGTVASSVVESKTVTATVNGTVVLAQTATVAVTANAPATMTIQTQPGGAVAGSAFATQPVVQLRDAFGNPAGGDVTVAILSGNGTLAGTGALTVSAVNGIATFTGLIIRGPRTPRDTLGTGPHVLRFTAPGFTAVNSDTVQVAVSFGYNILDVWTRNGCATGCHTFGVYANNLANGNCGGNPVPRVVPGDPASSLIYHKVSTAVPGCGVVMPTSGLMSQRQIDLVRDWILQGAGNN